MDAERYLRVLDRGWEWAVEKGEYVFGVAEHGGEGGGYEGDEMRVRLVCV